MSNLGNNFSQQNKPDVSKTSGTGKKPNYESTWHTSV